MYKIRVKVPKEYRNMLDNMIDQLETNNVAYTGNNGLIRSFSMQTKKARKNGHLLFSWNKLWKKSVVSSAPNIKVKKIKYGLEIIEMEDNK